MTEHNKGVNSQELSGRLKAIKGKVIFSTSHDTVERVITRYKNEMERVGREACEYRDEVTLDSLYDMAVVSTDEVRVDRMAFIQQFGREKWDTLLYRQEWVGDLIYEALAKHALMNEMPDVTVRQMIRMKELSNKYAENDLVEEISILRELVAIAKGDV